MGWRNWEGCIRERGLGLVEESGGVGRVDCGLGQCCDVLLVREVC